MERTIIKEELINFTYADITKFDFFEKGTYGLVYRISLQGQPGIQYALKKMDLFIGEKYFIEKENEIKREIEILRLISSNIKKPKSIPKFFGYYMLKDQQLSQISYCLAFELKEGSLKGLIEKRQKDNQRFSLEEIYNTLLVLLNIMTYLQLNSITHRDLKPGNILYSNLSENKEILYKSLTLIDFGGSKCLLPFNPVNEDHTIVMTKRYCAPELMFYSAVERKDKADFNPFRTDVFSLGLILLEMGTFKLPFSDKEGLKPHEYFNELDKENKKLLEAMKNYYYDLNKKNPEELKKLNDILNILTKCLTFKVEKRPDFLELFCDFNKIDIKNLGNKELILQQILDQDQKLSNGMGFTINYNQNCIIFRNILSFFKRNLNSL